jgi:hypothetical protein
VFSLIASIDGRVCRLASQPGPTARKKSGQLQKFYDCPLGTTTAHLFFAVISGIVGEGACIKKKRRQSAPFFKVE